MRSAYHTLRGGLRSYWGFAPIQPQLRARATLRFQTRPPLGAAIPAGGLGALGAPALPPRPPLTPLANPYRKTVGGFDSRLGPVKTPRLVRSERRAPRGPAAFGTTTAVVTPPLHSRGGWGDKGRRSVDFLRADSWTPFRKKTFPSPAVAAVALWAPATGGAPSPRPQTAPRLWGAVAALAARPPHSRDSGEVGAGDPSPLTRREFARLGLWAAGLAAPLGGRRFARAVPRGADLARWL